MLIIWAKNVLIPSGEGEILVCFFKPLHMMIENQWGKKTNTWDYPGQGVKCGSGLMGIIYCIIYQTF